MEAGSNFVSDGVKLCQAFAQVALDGSYFSRVCRRLQARSEVGQCANCSASEATCGARYDRHIFGAE